MAMEWINETLNTKWLSDGMKKGILADYGDLNPRYGFYRLSQIKRSLNEYSDLYAGTQRGYVKPPAYVLEAIHKGIDEGSFDRYSDKKAGEFRALISQHLMDHEKVEANPDTEITLCVGASFVIDAALRVLINPGDEVLKIDPDYESYEEQIASFGAKMVPVPLKEDPPGTWKFDVQELAKRITSKTKLLMLSNANNPSSYLFTKEDNETILELAQKHDFFIFSDQVSEQILFDGAKFHSIASLPGALERTIVGSSLSKLYNLAGLRIGWAVSNKKVIENISELKDWANDGIVAPGVDAGIALLSNARTKNYVTEVLSDLKKRRDFMTEKLSKMEGVIPNNPKGLHWAFPNVTSFGIPTQQLAEYLLFEGRVLVRPGTWYGRNGEGHIRLSFCVSWDWIKAGLPRLESALRKLSEKRKSS